DFHVTGVQTCALPIFFVAILVVCYFTIPSVKEFFNEAWNVLTGDDEKRIKSWVEGFGWLGPIVIVLAMVVQMFLLVIPTILLMRSEERRVGKECRVRG